MREQFDAFHSKNGIDYELKQISLFDIVRICDYHYKDFSFLSESHKKNMENVKEKIVMPVYFHHNDYWIIDGYDLARAIDRITVIHKRNWRKVVSGKWRLQPDWWFEWYKKNKCKSGNEGTCDNDNR